MVLDMKYPPLTSYGQYADLLSATMTLENGYKWYCNNYVNLFVLYRFSEHGQLLFRDAFFGLAETQPQFLYSYCPFVKNINIIDDYTMFFKTDELIDRFKSFIDDGYYFHIMVDRHYLNNNIPIGSIYFVLVYGYEDQSFLVADFVSDSGKYVYTRISFADLMSSYRGSYNLPKFVRNLNSIYMMKIENKDYCFDMDLFKRLLEDYKNERNSLDSPETIKHCEIENTYWGMAAYQYLINYLSLLDANSKIDLRSFCVLYDHKTAMCDRIQFFLDNQMIRDYSVLERYKTIKNDVLECVNLCVRYSISLNSNILDKCIKKLENIYTKEKVVIEELLACL